MIASGLNRTIVAAALGVLFGMSFVASPAQAGGPDRIEISSDAMPDTIAVTAGDDFERFVAVLGQVSYVVSRAPEAKAPAADKLGVKYTFVVLQGGAPKQTYDLYPLAAGGPRVFRPAKQPDKRKVSAGWFYGRLSMPDVLRDVGAPIPGPANSRGQGGGEQVENTLPQSTDVEVVLGEWRQVILLNGGVVVIIALGLAGIAYLIRRKV